MHLLEILIALIIIIILSVSGFSSLQENLEREEFNLLKKKIIHAIQLAREKAEITENPIGLCLIDQQQRCHRDGQNGLLIFSISENEQIAYVHRIYLFKQPAKGKFHLSNYPIYRNYLKFSASRLMNSDNGHFTYTKDIASYSGFKITINKLGRIIMTEF